MKYEEAEEIAKAVLTNTILNSEITIHTTIPQAYLFGYIDALMSLDLSRDDVFMIKTRLGL